MKLLYQIFILLYPLAARLIAPFNVKAREWVRGRRNVFKELNQFITASDKPVIWMHCSSLGEFEQGLPLAEEMKKNHPRYRLLVSFFSPSGYLVRKNHPIADFVTYLPMDSRSNAKKWMDTVNPALVLFIKYEFWHFYLTAIKARQVPTLLVSGIFRPDQLFFRFYGGFYRGMLKNISQFFVQDEDSKTLLTGIGFGSQTSVSGDTRFDRVITIAHHFQANEVIAKFCGSHEVIVAGSTWSEDDKFLHHLAIANTGLRMIVAPHDIQKERLEECLTFYPDAILYSDYHNAFKNNIPLTEARTLVIDNMGMLSSLYHYASIAFIGGGFTDEGIHNTLEAAVYGVPVVFGPVYDKYLEAVELIETGAAFPAEDVVELEQIIRTLLTDENHRKSAGIAAKKYVAEKAGATRKIMDYIQENRLLTS